MWRINLFIEQFTYQNYYMGIFGIVDYDFLIDFSKFNMANSIWRTKYFVTLNLIGIFYLGVFGTIDYESAIVFRKFNMA